MNKKNKKLNIKYICIFLTLLIFVGCTQPLIKNNSIHNIANMPTEITDKNKQDISNVEKITLEQNTDIIPKTILDKNNNIMIGKKLDTHSEIGMYNVITQETTIIKTMPNNQYFGIGFDSDTYVVFFTYQTEMSFALPNFYYIYNKKTGKLDSIDLSTLPGVSKPLSGKTDVSIDSEEKFMYFEWQTSEPSVSGNDLKSTGISIFRYDLNAQTIEKYVEGFSPKITNDGTLYFLNASNNAAALFKLTPNKQQMKIRENILEYTVHDNNVLFLEHNGPNSNYRSLILMENHNKLKRLYEGNDFAFWDIQMNNDYIFWQQSSAPLYIYDIHKSSFIYITDEFGARYGSISNNNVLFWLHVVETSKFDPNKNKILNLLQLNKS